MAFNMGVPRLGKFKKMWAAIESGDMEEASKQALVAIPHNPQAQRSSQNSQAG